jgi:hypothetical protein
MRDSCNPPDLHAANKVVNMVKKSEGSFGWFDIALAFPDPALAAFGIDEIKEEMFEKISRRFPSFCSVSNKDGTRSSVFRLANPKKSASSLLSSAFQPTKAGPTN